MISGVPAKLCVWIRKLESWIQTHLDDASSLMPAHWYLPTFQRWTQRDVSVAQHWGSDYSLWLIWLNRVHDVKLMLSISFTLLWLPLVCACLYVEPSNAMAHATCCCTKYWQGMNQEWPWIHRVCVSFSRQGLVSECLPQPISEGFFSVYCVNLFFYFTGMWTITC